jgi:hypothetical protein
METSRSITENSHPESLTKRSFKIIYYSFLVVLHLHVDYVSRSLYRNLTLLQHFSFNTNMSFFFNLFYFSYVLILNLPFGNSNKTNNLKFLQILAKFNFSISFVVFSFYWGMVAYDPSLILQDHANRILPFKYDIFLHGGNFLLNLVEHVFLFPKSDTNFIGFSILTCFYTIYLFYLKLLFHYFNIVIYPFIGVLELYQLGIILLSAVTLSNSGRFLYSFLARKDCGK